MKSVPLLCGVMMLGLLAAVADCRAQAGADNAPGSTKILKWPDGKKACFVLAFDDGAPSQLKNVVPELEKRKIPGTFYLVTGNGLYAKLKPRWEAAVQSPYVVVANHTFTHKGVTNPEELEPELAKNNEVLLALHPDRKKPRLLAFGKPGGVPWIVAKDELAAALARHQLVDRPPFSGPPIHYKSAADSVAVIERAIEKGEMGHLDFHGVGEDWLVTPLDWFTAILDKLEASRDVVWITDTVSWHKYVAERDGTEVKVVESSPAAIKIQLVSRVDPALYDQPLTLSTKVPEKWKSASVTQGATKASVPVQDGMVRYSAIPDGNPISLLQEGER